MGWEFSNVFRFNLGLLLQGQMILVRLKLSYKSLISGPGVLGCEINL